ncbi:expressed unknown protein [Seminavis robusta]|uniref:Uncharacterized protein n=1 Tax=Seminavis robusta TaxID=568900 RepID=A0A9N8DNC7_9STRA|nr:expressed unknown protein [Seminavis robusta]|eukprot:Sro178_g078180.1 n/a (244) ;mRNA; f:50357-51088
MTGRLSIFLGVSLVIVSSAFVPLTPQLASNKHAVIASAQNPPSTTTTSLNNGFLLDVPDSFFTVTFLGAGILLGISRQFNRLRMEERAWEQRLEEGRRRRLEQDPTLTELDLRRKEAELEWSAYGKPRMMREQAERELVGNSRRKRVKVLEREEDEDEEDVLQRQYTMTDDEIDRFELEFGIDYDPYYDDPYTEEELPEGRFNLDKQYGDRIYDDGEIFYKDADTGLYYRQGAKPRSISFFGP